LAGVVGALLVFAPARLLFNTIVPVPQYLAIGVTLIAAGGETYWALSLFLAAR
jgi:hypothetical protein